MAIIHAIKRILYIICILLTVALISLLIINKHTEHKYPAPGKLVDIGGYKLHINESYFAQATKDRSGEGSPSVILDAGFACFSLVWNLVQPEIAQFARVYSYDRAGLGWSEKSPLARTSTNMVKELHTLLEKVQAPKPYILVGHSFGGLIMQLYANTYPDEVFGLVLVDSSHESILEKSWEFNKTSYTLLPWMAQKWHHLLYWCGCETVSNFTGIRAIYLKSLAKNGIATITPAIKNSFMYRLLSPAAIYSRGQEMNHITESHLALAHSRNCFSNKPLIVISRGKIIDELHDNPKLWPYLTKVHEELWLPLQKELVAKSSKGKHIIARNSGHTIVWSEPELIIEAVKELVNEYHDSLSQTFS
jgi:pimeloyl-ACP methyl ester carboxylesterase